MPALFSSDEFALTYPTIYGIASYQRVLKIMFELSKQPDLDVECMEDITDYDEKSYFLNYLISYLDDNSTCLLVKNRGSSSFFYPRYKNIEYILCSLDDDEINPQIIHIIDNIPDISVCFALEIPNQNQILNFTKLQ